ncbi:hypothetical protein [Hahella ganghwensis]|uniref:hypothetical protein n=1 Tax=Hahella ganghwensis TaxID=286420 RepID=UPI0003A2C400|nr:hypothetical protein [Hahella ganghwensis]
MSLSLVLGLSLSLSACLMPDTGVQPSYYVAVVDRFYPGDEYYEDAEDRETQRWLYGLVDLDKDSDREPLYHGDIVSLFVSAPGIQVRRYVMSQGKLPQREILRQLKEIRKHVFWGEPLHALVLSWESSTLVSAFEKPLNLDHAAIYKEQVRQWGLEDETWRLSYQIIRLLEDIAETGIMVFTIAGNGGSGMVNTYSFATGVVTVGASEEGLQHFISENVFVTARARAVYQPVLVRDGAGMPIGYDLDGDACAEIPINCLTGYAPGRVDYPERPWPLLKGSSFAAPQALKQLLSGNANFCHSSAQIGR